MNNDIFPKPQISYTAILEIINKLIDEVDSDNFTPFNVKKIQEDLSERRQKNYKRKMKLDILLKLNQIKKYIVTCQTYQTMATVEKVQALKNANFFMSTWKGMVTRKQFAPYQYMLCSMLNLPMNTNDHTLKATKEIMENPYLLEYVQAYDVNEEKIIWQAPKPQSHFHLFKHFKQRKKK